MDNPYVAGHRGFKAEYPENTFTGFAKCLEAGAPIIETDLYLTADNVIVISHDNNTKRVFVNPDGTPADHDITKSTFDDLKDLKNKENGDPIIQFEKLLEWLVKQPQGSKLQLDIKRLNRMAIMKYIFRDLSAVNADLDFWTDKLQLGVWDLDYLKYVNQNEYFQDLKFTKPFDFFHISTSWPKSTEFIYYNHYLQETSKERTIFPTTGVSLLYLATWNKGFLNKFMPLCKLEGLKVYSWTVNNKFQYQYFTKACKYLDIVEYGVVSDHPDQIVKMKEGSSAFVPGSITSTLTMGQFFTGLLFKAFTSLGLKTPSPNFKAVVAEDYVPRVKLNPVFAKLFMVCQKFGIF